MIAILLGLLVLGLPRLHAADCNGNGSSDDDDLLHRLSHDCNGNGVPDECDLRPYPFGFAQPETFPIGFLPQIVVAGDLDGEGHPELVTVNGPSPGFSRSSLSVFRNGGRGEFGPALVLPLWGTSKALAVADLDSDGAQDLVSANYSSKDLSLYFNPGKAGFDEAASVPLEGRAIRVVAGDFDGDRRNDLAVALEEVKEVSLLRNVAGGTFQQWATVDLGSAPSVLLEGDFDGDGAADLAAASGRLNAVVTALNDGRGTFLPRRSFSLPANPVSLVASDFDRDGDLDLAAAGGSREGVWLLRNPGSGDFEPPASSPLPASTVAMAAGDLNGDGSFDLALAGSDSGGIVLLNDGGGRFALVKKLTPSISTVSVAASDLDGDGDVDVALAEGPNPLSRGLFILENRPDGSFALEGFLDKGSSSQAIAAADLDGDAQLDLAVASHSYRNLKGASVLLRDRRGGLLPPVNYTGGPGSPSGALVALDFDGDADLDLLSGGGYAIVLLNGGNGDFGAWTEYAGAKDVIFAAVSDFDEDGYLDLATASRGSSAVAVAINNGNGILADPAVFPVDGQPDFIVSADLDGDGRADLAAANRPTDRRSVSFLWGLGNGAFSPGQTLALPGAASLAASDLDADGATDLVTGSETSGTFWVLQNRGNGSFFAMTLRGATGDRVLASDLNGDALPDVAFNVKGADGVAVLLSGWRKMTFLTPVRFTGTGPVASLVSGDLDGDGRVDLAALGGAVSVLLNRTSPPPSLDRDQDGIPDECERTAFHRGDPNGDGEVDISDAVSVLDYLFSAGTPPSCQESADADNDGGVDLSDPIALLNFLFLSGARPASPGPPPQPCGPDSDPPGSQQDLGCSAYDGCRQ